MDRAITQPPANEIPSQTSFLNGDNAAYIESLQASYQQDPLVG